MIQSSMLSLIFILINNVDLNNFVGLFLFNLHFLLYYKQNYNNKSFMKKIDRRQNRLFNLPLLQNYQGIAIKIDRQGLFNNLKQKQNFIQQLRKGTLFRLSQKISKIDKTQFIPDPYKQWLYQTSQIEFTHKQQINKSQQKHTIYEFQKQQKQKKQVKNNLPKIIKVNNQIDNLKESNIQLSHQHKLNDLMDIGLNMKNKQKLIKKQRSNFHKIQLNSLKQKRNHKVKCYNDYLSKTKLQKYQVIQENQIKLNANKTLYSSFQKAKKPEHSPHSISKYVQKVPKRQLFSQSFYINTKIDNQIDNDLRRIKGLNSKKTKDFLQNLKSIQNKNNHTCYNQLNSYFQKMKTQTNYYLTSLNSVKHNHFQSNQLNNNKYLNKNNSIQSKQLNNKQDVNQLNSIQPNQLNNKENIYQFNSVQSSKIKQSQKRKNSFLPTFLIKRLKSLPRQDKQQPKDKSILAIRL